LRARRPGIRCQTVFMAQLWVLASSGVTWKHTFCEILTRRTQRIRDFYMRVRYINLHFIYLLAVLHIAFCSCLQVHMFIYRVARNLEYLQYSGISVNMESSANSVKHCGKNCDQQRLNSSVHWIIHQISYLWPNECICCNQQIFCFIQMFVVKLPLTGIVVRQGYCCGLKMNSLMQSECVGILYKCAFFTEDGRCDAVTLWVSHGVTMTLKYWRTVWTVLL